MKAEDMLQLPRSVWKRVGGKAATKIVKDSDKGFGTNEAGNRYKFKGILPNMLQRKLRGKPDLKE